MPDPALAGPLPGIGASPSSRVHFVDRLAEHGHRPALLTDDATLTYAGLAERVQMRAEELGPHRRLVMVAGRNELETVITYLAALSGGHPVLLVPGGNVGNRAALERAYDPDVVADGRRLRARHPESRHPGSVHSGSVHSGSVHSESVHSRSVHDLHPSLALLLSTSGSTGSPKLVRLSSQNLSSNAEAIADFLSIRPTDVAATTLPLHYCYGLSVIHSHLHAGAAVLLTSLSVMDAEFWDLARRKAVTSFAGVPYTFELLDRVGFEAMHLPSLRYVTQAGGRLAPETVRRYVELGQRRGWDLFVMYGQTEATARMSYLPPDLAAAHPSTIGIPISGGSFRLEPLPELPLEGGNDHDVEVGELVYSGDNVMLGYAESPADLGRGRDITELRTGDVARRTPGGLFEIIGRRNRFAKIFGVRVDLDQTEAVFADAGVMAACIDGGDHLVVGVDVSAKPVDVGVVEAVAREHFGLPAVAVRVVPLAGLPRLPNGKVDYRSIGSRPRAPRHDLEPRSPDRHDAVHSDPAHSDIARTAQIEAVVDLVREVLRRPDAQQHDSFITLGGDSLSYVEMSIRLEGQLGHLPADWHVTSLGDLAASAGVRPVPDVAPVTASGPPPPASRGLRTVETNVALRALAIVLIVGSHANVFALLGGAHVLLGVAGFNFGRFQVTAASRGDRLRHLGVSIARIAIPSMLWIGALAIASPAYSWRSALLLNGVLGPRTWTDAWQYWFVEALVVTLVGAGLLLAVPWVDRLERRWSFWLPFGLAMLGLLTRYQVVVLLDGDVIHRANVTFWLFALGWATVKATSSWQRALVSLVVVATVPGFFGDPGRELLVAAGMLLLVWVRSVRVPEVVAKGIAVLASASLYIYLVHWQIYPHLEDRFPLAALALSLAAGLTFWRVAERWMPYVDGRARPAP